MLILRAALVWLLIACLAVANGMLRDILIGPALGERIALPASGLLLALCVLAVTWLTFPFLGRQLTRRAYLGVGVQWVCMTLVLDAVLGRVLQNQTWRQLLEVFDVSAGNLFLLVLLVSLFAPLSVARLKGVA